MPTIIPIRDLRNTSEISEMAHKKQEPIFITKNGYSDLVIMSTELYEKIAQLNRIDQAIFEAEKDFENGSQPISVEEARKQLDEKYFKKLWLPPPLIEDGGFPLKKSSDFSINGLSPRVPRLSLFHIKTNNLFIVI